MQRTRSRVASRATSTLVLVIDAKVAKTVTNLLRRLFWVWNSFSSNVPFHHHCVTWPRSFQATLKVPDALTLITGVESFLASLDIVFSSLRLRRLDCVVTLLVTVETSDMTQVFTGPTGSTEGFKVFLGSLVIPYFFSFQIFLSEVSPFLDHKKCGREEWWGLVQGRSLFGRGGGLVSRIPS